MKSAEFFKAVKAGKLGDDAEWFDWIFVYEAYNKIIRQKKIIDGLSLWPFAILKRSKTFPYHVHLPDGVKESKQVTLIDVLDKIENVVIAKLESDVE